MSAKGLSSRAIIGEFYRSLAQNMGSSWVPGVSMLFQSDQESETYKWLGMSPQMREWVGGRHAKGFRENGITIANKHYEATMEVLVREMRRDKTGQVMLRVREMARRTNAHWAKLLSSMIVAGASTTCYDGQYFFDTDHAEGDSGTQSNDLTIDISALPVTNAGSITAPSAAEIQQCILQAVQAIYGFKDDQGEPMNEEAAEFVVMVPTPLWSAANAAVALPMLDTGAANVIPSSDFRLRVAANARLTWTAQFAVFRTDSDTKALIRQEEEEVMLKAIAEGSELEFNEDKHHYGVDAWRNVGYGFWQDACLVTMT